MRDSLIQKFNENIEGGNQYSGNRIFEDGLVSEVDVIVEDATAFINSNVVSENLFKEYQVSLEVDLGSLKVLHTNCNCMDFKKRSGNRQNYCCKHIIATLYKSTDELCANDICKANIKKESTVISVNKFIEDSSKKDEIKFNIYLNKDPRTNNIAVSLKVGLKNHSALYSVRDIKALVMAVDNNFPIKYSSKYSFDLDHQSLNSESRKLIERLKFFREYNIDSGIGAGRDNKYVVVPRELLRDFLVSIKDFRIFLYEGFFNREVETEVFLKDVPFDFDLKLLKGKYVLKSKGGLPTPLSKNEDVFLYGADIYIPSHDFCYAISPFLASFNNCDVLIFSNKEEKNILKFFLPKIKSITENVTIDKSIEDKIVTDKCNFKFFLDTIEDNLNMRIEVIYGKYSFNIYNNIETDKVIYRDAPLEKKIIKLVQSLGFIEHKEEFYMIDEDKVYEFLLKGIAKLKKHGEIYYSDTFKGFKNNKSTQIIGEIKPGRFNYLSIDFKIENIPKEENIDILRSFRDSKKFYKLKSGEMLDLREGQLRTLMEFLDLALEGQEDELFKLNRDRAAIINSKIEKNNLRYLEGGDLLESRWESLNSYKELNYELPKGLNGNLREYQKTGYRWLRTLDDMGLGGILADDMGLGKTIQAISFILSKKDKKTLIVAPSSLVYNWEMEFKKFAPSLKILVNNDDSELRNRNLDEEDFDVCITTYNLLRIDLENYKKKYFDYMILDEGQNIKNPHSKNTIAVKQIDCGRRFILSGTPMENSLMELWSLFDFIMPGYLYDEKRFNVRYNKQLKQSGECIEELKNMIAPFILRRKKAEVLRELPEKIEKKMIIPLSLEEQKIYKTYAKYANDLMEKTVEEDEFKRRKVELLAYITKLRQICIDPSLVMNNFEGVSSKVKALVEIVESAIDEGHKIIVFSQFTSALDIVCDIFKSKEIKYQYLNGSTPTKKRLKIVDEFNNNEENKVFLISLKAGGTGLNITSADMVVHLDPWWNPAVEEQANDRAHRIGQKKVVEVIKLIAKNTVEEKVVSMQEDKKQLIEEVIDKGDTGHIKINSLSKDEFTELFRVTDY